MLTTEWNIEEEIAYVRQEALEEGLEKGLQEGWGKRNFAIAKNALAEGATIEFVQKITGLDLDVIQDLQEGSR